MFLFHKTSRMLAALLLCSLYAAVLSGQNQLLTLEITEDTIGINQIAVLKLQGQIPDYSSYATLPLSSGYAEISHTESSVYVSTASEMSLTQTFTLMGQKSGTYIIGPLWIQSGSKRYFSNEITITVKDDHSSSDRAGYKLVMVPSTKTAYVGQPIALTAWVLEKKGGYFSPGYDNPQTNSLNGFWNYQCPFDTEYGQLDDSTFYIKGQRYNGRAIYREFLFPNSTGQLTIPEYSYDCTVRQTLYATGNDYMDELMATETPITLYSDSFKILVEDPPAANQPAEFMGDIGNFTIEAHLDKNSLKANEALRFTVTVTGEGNVHFLQMKKPVFPDGFEVFDAVMRDTVMQSIHGIYGYKTFTYTVIPKKEGKYTFEGAKFSYYDLKKKEYIVLKSPEEKIDVAPGDPVTDTVDGDLPDGFLTPKNPIWKVLFWMLITLIPSGIAIWLFLRWKKKKKEQDAIRKKEEAEQKAKELLASVKPGDPFRARLRSAEMFFMQRNTAGGMQALHETLHAAVSTKCELSREEASMSQVRYRLRTKKIEQADIDFIVALMEKLALQRYAFARLSSQETYAMFQETSEALSKLGY
jgi:BatD DUF11 like domain